MSIVILLVRIFGGLIWIGFGLGIWKIWSITKEKKDYTQYPTTTGTVHGGVSFNNNGYRQLVDFVNAEGKECKGMHDRIGKKGFPETDTTQQIYYWPIVNGHYRLNREPIEYYIHYCDECIYQSEDEKGKGWPYLLPTIGTALIVFGVYIMFLMKF